MYDQLNNSTNIIKLDKLYMYNCIQGSGSFLKGFSVHVYIWSNGQGFPERFGWKPIVTHKTKKSLSCYTFVS